MVWWRWSSGAGGGSHGNMYWLLVSTGWFVSTYSTGVVKLSFSKAGGETGVSCEFVHVMSGDGQLWYLVSGLSPHITGALSSADFAFASMKQNTSRALSVGDSSPGILPELEGMGVGVDMATLFAAIIFCRKPLALKLL